MRKNIMREMASFPAWEENSALETPHARARIARNAGRLFVVGAGRSGTSFLWRILNNNPGISLATEIHYFSSLYHDGFLKNLERHTGKQAGLTRGRAYDCLATGGHFGDYWQKVPAFERRTFDAFFSKKSVSAKNIYEYLLFHDLLHKPGKAGPVRYIGEKTPLNVFHLATLFRWYPRSRVLFIFRNPIHVLKSEANKKHKPDYPIKKRNVLYYYGLVAFVLLEWLGAAAMALFHHKTTRGAVIILSYELLVSRCGPTVRSLASALGIKLQGDECRVPKVGSSFSADAQGTYWHPPKPVEFLYSLVTKPVTAILNRCCISPVEKKSMKNRALGGFRRRLGNNEGM